MPLKKLLIIFLFAAAWSGYYVIFYRLSGLPFSWFSLLFTIAGTVSLAMFIVSVSKIRGFLLGLLVLLAVMIYGLVSFGFFTVFGNFDFTSSVGVPLAQMIPFAIEFSRIIPWQLYLASVGIVSIYVVLFLYIRTDRRLVFLDTEVFSERVRHPLFVTAVVLLFQFVPFSFAWYLYAHPLQTWWNPRAKAADWGIIGNLYGRAAHAARETYRAHLPPQTSALVQSEIVSATLAVHTVAQGVASAAPIEPSTAYDVVRAMLNRLAPATSSSTALYGAALSAETVTHTSVTRPHIIAYQLESVPAWAVGPDSAMPFLYALRQRTITTHAFFANSCHTINAEFTTVCSLFSPIEGPVQPEHVPQEKCLPSILHREFGYATSLYHANTMAFWKRTGIAPRLGFDRFVFSPHFAERAPDRVVLKEVVQTLASTTTPQLAYVVGFTSHAPHVQSIMDDQQRRFGLTIKRFDGPIDREIVMNSELDEDALRDYMGFLRVVDDSIRGLFADLEEKHLLDKTIIALFGDHRYYNFPSMTTENWLRYNQIPFALWVPGERAQNVRAIGSHVDIAPTLLQLVAGEQYTPREEMLGTSLFAYTQRPPVAVTTCHLHAEMYDGNRVIHGDTATGIYAKVGPTGAPTPAGPVGGYVQAAVMEARKVLGGR